MDNVTIIKSKALCYVHLLASLFDCQSQKVGVVSLLFVRLLEINPQASWTAPTYPSFLCHRLRSVCRRVRVSP